MTSILAMTSILPMNSILKAKARASASTEARLNLCWAASLAALLLATAGAPVPAGAQSPEVISVGEQEETGRFELFIGGNTGGANWRILGREALLPVDFNGFRMSGYYQTSVLYARFSLRWDTLTVHGTGESQPSFSRTDLSGHLLGSLVRGQAGGLAAGLYGRYNRSYVYANPQGGPQEGSSRAASRLELREAETVGALLAFHTDLDASARLILMGGGLVEWRSTGVDLPVPQLLAGGMVGARAEFPIGAVLRAHLQADAGRWGWSSPQVEAGLTGELVEGFFWDGSARLSIRLFGGFAVYGGVEASGRSETVRFREGPREVEVSEDFMSRLSGTFGIVFRDL